MIEKYVFLIIFQINTSVKAEVMATSERLSSSLFLIVRENKVGIKGGRYVACIFCSHTHTRSSTSMKCNK